jgi:hypothetical protein
MLIHLMILTFPDEWRQARSRSRAEESFLRIADENDRVKAEDEDGRPSGELNIVLQ